MRILLVGDYPDDSRLGSAKVYHKLAEELRGLGHDCHVLLAPDLGERPARARLRWAAGPLLAARAVARAFRAHGGFDVVDVASAEGFALGVRRAAGGYRGVGLVSRSHGLEHRNYRRMLDDAAAGLAPKPWTRRIWYPLARLTQVAGAARLAHRLVVLNRGDAELAVRRGWKPADRVHVVPHGVSGRFLTAAPPAEAPRGRGILFCGSWDHVKGIAALAAAYARVRERLEVGLTVLGPGADAATVLGAFPERVRGGVTVLPRAPEDEVMRHYADHDVLAHPSTFEGFGMAVVEAMSQRLPVVATAQGCAPLVIRPGESGLLVPERAPEALAEALVRVLTDSALAHRLGEAAHQAVRGMTWRATAEQTLQVYEAALRDARQLRAEGRKSLPNPW